MIYYISTRGETKRYTFSEVLLKGIASDGGLFVPESLPVLSLSKLKQLLSSSYQEIATFFFSLFETGYSSEIISGMVAKAYGKQFDTPAIAPVRHLKKNQFILELWHGPTLAFKDMALQIMPLFFVDAVQRDNLERQKAGQPPLLYRILVATSGDTGKAALEGYKDKEGVSIVVFYPHQRVSKLQELQMITQEGNNVLVCAVKGDFDAAQRCVKQVFADTYFNKKLLDGGVILSSANSINWGRLLPQIVYYVSGYLDLVENGTIHLGDAIDVCVPTGNFGNILAGYYVKQMGLPIRRFLCASNENNVLSEFLWSGMYDLTDRHLVETPSPSMDILLASNIERLLYLLTNDTKKVAAWMADLLVKKQFEVDDETKQLLQREFVGDYVSNEESLQNIKQIFEETSYLIDTHTSVAQLVAERYSYKEVTKPTTVVVPMLILSTAHFSKFGSSVYKALSGKTGKDEFVMLREISKLTKASLPKKIMDLVDTPVRFRDECVAEKAAVEKIIM